MNPTCPHTDSEGRVCGSESRPCLDPKELRPRGSKPKDPKLPAWECLAEGHVFIVVERPSVPDYDDRQSRAAGN